MIRWLLPGFAFVLALLLALGTGERWINPLHPGNAVNAAILWDLRLPRLLMAFAVGGLLALAGAWFQVLLGNPLAEPYVLGVAGSASVGAVAALLVAPHSTLTMSLGAFVGAWVGIAAVARFARLGPGRMLLAGVVLAAFWAAVLSLLLALLSQQGLYRAFAWMMGDLSRADVPLWLMLAAWLVALGCGLWLARDLDRLMLGERHAAALGVDVRALRMRVLWLASAATALAVTAAGTIGFIGLVAPHLMRLLFGALHARMLPAAALGGGALLALADTLARTVTAPAELPVGVFTAMLGVPLFLWLLLRSGR
ncbi:MAG: iron ABC transporter permease [Mariprofundaceae bacterium]